jgi:hypothetical protein
MSAASDAVRGVFLGNLGTKFVAVLVAVGLWFYIGKELTGVEVFHAELSIELSEDIRADWRILDKPVRRVQVTLQGPAKMIDTLRGREGEVIKGRAVIDSEQLGGKSALADGGKTTFRLQLDKAFFEPLPYVALRLQAMEPNSLTVELGALVTEELEIDLPRLTSDTLQKGVPEGMDVEVRVSRTKVRVRGPSEAINGLKGKLRLAPVPIEQANGTLIEQGRLHPEVEAAHITWAAKARPTVTVLITPKPSSITLRVDVRLDIPRELKIPPNAEWKMDDTVQVQVTGPADVIELITANALVVYAEIPVDVPLEVTFAQALAKLTPAWRRGSEQFRKLDFRIVGNDELDFQIRVPPAPEQPDTPGGNSGGDNKGTGAGGNNGAGGGDNGGSGSGDSDDDNKK